MGLVGTIGTGQGKIPKLRGGNTVNSWLRTGLVVAVVALIFVGTIQGADFEWIFEPIEAVEVTNPPIPNVSLNY